MQFQPQNSLSKATGKTKIHVCVLGIGVCLQVYVQTHTMKHQLDFIRWISLPANYLYHWKLEKSLICGSKQRGNKLIANPGIFHTLFHAFHKCHDEVHHFKREYTQVSGGRTVKSAPQKAVCEQMAWVVLAAKSTGHLPCDIFPYESGKNFPCHIL